MRFNARNERIQSVFFFFVFVNLTLVSADNKGTTEERNTLLVYGLWTLLYIFYPYYV